MIDEIKKAMDCSSSAINCSECNFDECKAKHIPLNIINLIEALTEENNCQKTEIERLKKHLDAATDCINDVEDAAYRGTSNDYIDRALEKYANFEREND